MGAPLAGTASRGLTEYGARRIEGTEDSRVGGNVDSTDDGDKAELNEDDRCKQEAKLRGAAELNDEEKDEEEVRRFGRKVSDNR